MSVFRNQKLNLRFFDGFLLVFYPQNLVAIVQIKIDAAMGKSLLQGTDNMPGNQLITDISFENLYKVHIDKSDLKNVKDARLGNAISEIGFYS